MPSGFDFSRFQFGPVIDLPASYEVYDFTSGYDPERPRSSDYGIGRYAEKRPGMYSTELFTAERGAIRDIHVGVDIAAPVGTEVKAFYEGVVCMVAINAAEGDYGGTVITQHALGDRLIWALHGHLSHRSVNWRKPGDAIRAGDIIGWVGAREENGGWNPHLHFQLSWERPERCDLPGAVNEKDLARALEIYPDPRLVLGPLY
jgi:peptidoglycan LD-endopeptidase LytH